MFFVKRCYNAQAYNTVKPLHLAVTVQASILFVSSILAYIPKPPLSAYAISKTALLGAVKALAQELGPEGIRVNGIAPGIVPTKFSSALVASDDLRKQQVCA